MRGFPTDFNEQGRVGQLSLQVPLVNLLQGSGHTKHENET